MTIVYDDQFEDPAFEPVRLNGKDGAWDLYLEGEEDGDSITFENSRTVDDYLAAVAAAAKAAGIDLRETLAVLR